ncbi:MAG: T9SS type A sorting domain-containing protein [Flavobacterium sp.]|nr:T9SS type A sorting domain-containing protein [Flavobacterium sp.]
MKKITLLIFIVLNLNGFSQHKVAEKMSEIISANSKFQKISVFENATNSNDSNMDKVVANATLTTLKLSEVNNIVTNQYEYLELQIPFNNQIIEIQLYKVDIFAFGFHVDSDVSKNIIYQKGVYYRGIVKNDFTSVVSFNFFKDECNGVISSDVYDNLVIGKLVKPNNILNYIIYKDSDLKILNTFKCNTKEIATKAQEMPKSNRNPQSTRCVTFYFEIDHDLYLANNSNTTTTTNWMTSVFNNVQTLYNNDGITVGLKSLYIWQNADIYSTFGYTSSSDYLYKFHEIRPVFDGDLGQLVSIDSGGLGGVAVTIDGLCSNNNFSYGDINFQYSTVPTYSWTIEVITHEFGHLMGSPHTHGCYWNGNNTAIDGCAPTANASYAEGSCPTGPIPSGTTKGTIMSYCHLVNGVGIKLSNGFGPQPAARILAAVNGGTCLSTNCTTTCSNKILATNVTNVTKTAATVTWTEQGGTQTSEVAIYPLSATSGVYSNPASNSYTATGLTPNTYYKAVVRKMCSGGLIGPEITQIFVTDGDFCSGISLTDSGGTTGDYLDFENITRVIIPTNPFAKAKITFSFFDIELDYDYFQIFNGHDTSFPEISGTVFGYTGNTLPPAFESTANDGALTIKFVADGGLVMPGYVASISCNTLGNNSFEKPIDFSYSPNPTNGLVNIFSKSEISEVSIYNVAGQLLFNNKINDLHTKIDITNYAFGTYFFKLKFGDLETNFKILKM